MEVARRCVSRDENVWEPERWSSMHAPPLTASSTRQLLSNKPISLDRTI